LYKIKFAHLCHVETKKFEKKNEKEEKKKQQIYTFFEDKFTFLSLSDLPPYTLFEARP
jgi:hypothetical protein